MATNGKRGIQELSVDTSLLAERIRKLAVGESINYQDLSAVISRDVRREAHSNLQSARRIALMQNKIVTTTIRGEGIKRLDDNAIVSTAEYSTARIHREARRGIQRLGCIGDIEALDNSAKIKLNAARAGLGALHEITKVKSLAKLERAVEKTQATLPLAGTLAAFTGKD